MLRAFTRMPTEALVDCELTHLERTPIDVEKASRQHREYERCLAEMGCMIERLPELPGQADAAFVEDTVVVLPGLAVITRPGVESRQAETASMAKAIARYRPVEHIHAPGTLDGGDVLSIGKTLYVGASGRTNESGIEQLRKLSEPYGISVRAIPVEGCLHLKSAVADVSDGILLVNPDWIDRGEFPDLEIVEVHPDEPFATSVLRIGEEALMAAGFPRTRDRLVARGISVREIDYSEMAKAEAGLTCCSVIFETDVRN